MELFPTRIRYTSMSLPYHIGNGWFGGFLPTVSFALVVYTGDIFYGLWYPVVVTGVSLVVGMFCLKETRACGYRQQLTRPPEHRRSPVGGSKPPPTSALWRHTNCCTSIQIMVAQIPRTTHPARHQPDLM
ncbi:hypothetical protein DENIT_100009 [Pseudomonas veronii]|nr:hypothetical protein DENIT_100009 [Pseudomonas veronii]